ncbi:unnamed protein product [Lactuca saligna]|uniref:Uncharacterized protein n=1 Tax=Lactuca saligna TaxID=75948 RepID=A0AA35VD69_LACSI|nr:unnamed protein product [Lactuca saligna]
MAPSDDEYSQAIIKSHLETPTKEHSANLEKMNKTVDASATVSMKSCIADVNVRLLDIIEIHDTMIIITMKKHLYEKLRIAFSMLQRLEGVIESSSISKQGAECVTQSKKEDPKPSVKHTA